MGDAKNGIWTIKNVQNVLIDGSLIQMDSAFQLVLIADSMIQLENAQVATEVMMLLMEFVPFLNLILLL
jgi:hypothetical protein